MRTLWQDIRFGFRMLFKNPGFSLLVVVLLAISVGANTAVFSILNAFLIRPLPYEKPDRLVRLYQYTRKGQMSSVSRPNYLDWRQQAKSFEVMGYYRMKKKFWRLTDAEPTEEYMTATVSGNIFRVLGVKPFRGRLLSDEDEDPSAASVVVVSHAFWKRCLGADPQLIGKLTLDGHLVVGVSAPGFQYPPYEHEPPDLWVPIVPRQGDEWLRDRDNRLFRVLGRLRAGVDVRQAQAEMDMIAARLAAEYPSENENVPGARVKLLSDLMTTDKRRPLAIMMGAVAFIFLVACANLAGLLFARGVARERELAVRSALGAPRWRLLRQMAIENLLLACLGGGLGVLGAHVALELLTHTDVVASMMLPPSFFRLDMRVLGFALGISILGVPLVGLLPSFCCAAIDLSRVLASGGRSVLGSRGQNAVHMGLIAGEVAVTIVLLVAAGLMIHSFINVVTTDPGFDPENVWARGLYLPGDGTKQRQLLEQLHAIPGIEKAALAFPVLGGWGYSFCVKGQAVASPDQALPAEYRIVSPEYYQVMGIRLLKGRFFNERDHASSSPVAIVDETLAKYCWPDGDAIGKHIQHGQNPDPNSPWLEIVGVVANTRNQGLEAEPRMQIYMCIFQRVHGNASIVLRTKGDPSAFVAPVKAVVHPFDPRPRAVRTLDQMLGGPSVMRRLITSLLAAFGGITLFLSAMGIYAITRYSISRRTQEFGIRMALGARSNDVLKLVFRRGLSPVLVGVAVGLAGSVAITRVLSRLLFDLSLWDPVTYAGVSLLLLAVALLACYLPARRAAKIDPMEALRHE